MLRKKKIISLRLLNYGWFSKLIKREGSYFVSLNKPVVVGSALQKGAKLYSRLAEGEDNCSYVLICLDSDVPNNTRDLEMVSRTAFVERKN